MSRTDVVGRDAAILSAVEIGLGSVLHGLRIPFSGYALSLNQGFLLSRSVLKNRDRFLPFSISSIAAMLKALSPAGKKLTPMLAISAQGFLFGVGTTIFGGNLVGVAVGSVLASVWGFLQPLLIYYVLFGQTLIQVAEYYYRKTSESFAFAPEDLLWVLAAILALKAALSVALAVAAWLMPDSWVEAYREKLLSARNPRAVTPARLSAIQAAKFAARDLLHPLFLISLVLTAFFLVFAETGPVMMIWTLLRPVALGFVLFFLIRWIRWESSLGFVENRLGMVSFAGQCRSAVQALKRI